MIGLVGGLALPGALFPTEAAENPSARQVSFYVQFIVGTNAEKPASPEWKEVGAKLSGTLSPVFRWEHYWEVNRNHVVVTRGRVIHVPLGDERELHIRLLSESQAELSLFKTGELRRKLVRKIDGEMSILGGDKDERDGWFVVVRRDKPTLD